ncbi:MAG: Do family serine endopeptidase, partial [Rhodobacteraceae bacterium]|nr:Do family serine endopeptidase [Paracoccaceae bacterium]
MLKKDHIGRGRAGLRAGASGLALLLTLSGGAAFAEDTAVVPMVSYADIVAADKPAVVTVTTEVSVPQQTMQSGPDGAMPPEEFFRRFFEQNGPIPGMPQMPGMGDGQGMGHEAPPQKGQALGSGFIISADGTIVTNNHVVENATKITVTLDDGKELPAKLVGTDAKNDIAVLKIEPEGRLPTVSWGNSDALRAGDPVLAIGDPFGIGTTVTSGIVSARGRDLHSGPYDDFIQVDAAINHGNSGGPLVDATGKVVGINTAIYSPNGGNVGVGFAIPSAQAQKVVEKILADGTVEHGFIGVSIQPVDAQIAGAIGLTEAKGALVAAVQPDSPAAKAGIAAGDVILSVNGSDVADPRAVSRAIADLAPGDKAELALWREGKVEKLTLIVGRLGGVEPPVTEPAVPKAEGTAVSALGVTLHTL